MALRILLAVQLAIAVMLASITPASAAETITFRLTLRGEVNPADSFFLGIEASNGIVYDVGMMCGPAGPNNPAEVPVCSETSFDADLGGEVGVELTYTFSRDPLYDGSGDTSETIHTGTVTVTGSQQTVTVVYEYEGATLPDTALPPPGAELDE